MAAAAPHPGWVRRRLSGKPQALVWPPKGLRVVLVVRWCASGSQEHGTKGESRPEPLVLRQLSVLLLLCHVKYLINPGVKRKAACASAPDSRLCFLLVVFCSELC